MALYLSIYRSCPPVITPKNLASLTNAERSRLAPAQTPYRGGTTHIILEPLDFIARLAALLPRPRVNLTRFHGVSAPLCPLGATTAGVSKSRPPGTADVLTRPRPMHNAAQL